MLKKIGVFLFCAVCAISAKALPLDLLVVYDKTTFNAYSGNPQARIAALVNWANFAHSNSGTGVQLNLIGARYLDLPRASGTPIDADFLARVTNDPSVMGLRNTLKPALTVYLTNAYIDTKSGFTTCGIASLPPSPTQTYGNTNAALLAVSVVAYNCTEDVLAHETGHNLGAGHGAMDTAYGKNGYPITSSRGYGVQGLFTDTMAYPHLYGTLNQLMIFSSPNFGGCSGLTCGTQSDNAAGGIKQFALEVAKYPMCYPASTPDKSANPGYSWSCQKLCTSLTPVNINLTCSSSYCAESFGRTCAAAGGQTAYLSSGYTCTKPTTSACPTTVKPAVCGANHLNFVGNYSTTPTSSSWYIGNAIPSINNYCGSCGYRMESLDRGITVNAYCL